MTSERGRPEYLPRAQTGRLDTLDNVMVERIIKPRGDTDDASRQREEARRHGRETVVQLRARLAHSDQAQDAFGNRHSIRSTIAECDEDDAR